MKSYTRNYRISTKRGFQEFFNKGFRFDGSFFVFKIIPYDRPQLAVMVSKKFGNAVYRNYIKRLIREMFRQQISVYPVKILIRQVYPFKFKRDVHLELKQFFYFLNDYYFILMHEEGNLSLKEAIPTRKMSFITVLVFFLILFYKKYLSKLLPGGCRFQPTCSEYALDALRVYGFCKGLYLTAARLLRCQPFGGSGYDPIPKPKIEKKFF